MNGAWAQACDLRMERLTDPEDWSEAAAYQLGFAIYVKGPEGRKSVEKAGAYIRAWRKSLPDQGVRHRDASSADPDGDLLWWALRDVTAVAVLNPTDAMAAMWLRRAEAMLRTWWKRSQP